MSDLRLAPGCRCFLKNGLSLEGLPAQRSAAGGVLEGPCLRAGALRGEISLPVKVTGNPLCLRFCSGLTCSSCPWPCGSQPFITVTSTLRGAAAGAWWGSGFMLATVWQLASCGGRRGKREGWLQGGRGAQLSSATTPICRGHFLPWPPKSHHAKLRVYTLCVLFQGTRKAVCGAWTARAYTQQACWAGVQPNSL